MTYSIALHACDILRLEDKNKSSVSPPEDSRAFLILQLVLQLNLLALLNLYFQLLLSIFTFNF